MGPVREGRVGGAEAGRGPVTTRLRGPDFEGADAAREEIEFHIECRAQRLISEGWPEARAWEEKARDAWRHPVETLEFFGVEPSDTVIEIWPGGGWYTNILAPYLAAGGGTAIRFEAEEK